MKDYPTNTFNLFTLLDLRFLEFSKFKHSKTVRDFLSSLFQKLRSERKRAIDRDPAHDSAQNALWYSYAGNLNWATTNGCDGFDVPT